MQQSGGPLSVLLRIALGVAATVAATGAVVLFLQPNAVPQASASQPPTASATAPLATSGATAIATASLRPTPAGFALTLSDADLTKAAATGFPQTVSGVTVSEPDVRIESAGVRLVAKASVLFGTTQFVLTATPTVADGRITTRVDTATLAGMTLPDSTRAAIADTVQGTIAKLIPANVRVTSLTIAPGRLTVQGTQP